MATGGPVFPFSQVPDNSGDAFPFVYSGDGAGISVLEEGLGVAESIGADVTWHLRFALPPTFPQGSPTLKLRLIAQADAITGAAKVNPKWASVAMGEDPSSATLQAEGTQTFTWSTDDDDEYQEIVVDLDADTAVVDEIIVMALVFETSGWGLNVPSNWQAMIFWE
jgi:hypothetical protein